MILIFFLNWGPSLILEMVKQGTSNLVHKLTMASFNRRMIKYPQMGCGQGYVTIFLTFWTLNIANQYMGSRIGFLNFIFWASVELCALMSAQL